MAHNPKCKPLNSKTSREKHRRKVSVAIVSHDFTILTPTTQSRKEKKMINFTPSFKIMLFKILLREFKRQAK